MKYLTMIQKHLHSRLQRMEETLNRAADSLDRQGEKGIKEGTAFLANAWS